MGALFKTHFGNAERIKIHCGFSRPMSEKVVDLLRLARTFEADEAPQLFLESLKAACNTCLVLDRTPV